MLAPYVSGRFLRIALCVATSLCAAAAPRAATNSSAAFSRTASDSAVVAEPDEDPHAEIRRLFGEVESTLRRIDRMLAGAAGEERALDRTVRGARDGIDAALDRTRAESRHAIDAIDRILELTNHPHPPGGT